jgi:hypothetical protein
MLAGFCMLSPITGPSSPAIAQLRGEGTRFRPRSHEAELQPPTSVWLPARCLRRRSRHPDAIERRSARLFSALRHCFTEGSPHISESGALGEAHDRAPPQGFLVGHTFGSGWLGVDGEVDRIPRLAASSSPMGPLPSSRGCWVLCRSPMTSTRR